MIPGQSRARHLIQSDIAKLGQTIVPSGGKPPVRCSGDNTEDAALVPPCMEGIGLGVMCLGHERNGKPHLGRDVPISVRSRESSPIE